MTTLKTDIEVIDEAIELVSRDDGWCQGAYCKNSEGLKVNPSVSSPTGWIVSLSLHTSREFQKPIPAAAPTTFCLEGAIEMATGWLMMHPGNVDGDWFKVAPKISQQVERIKDMIMRTADPDCEIGEYLNEFNDHESTSKEDAIQALKLVREQLVEQTA